MMILLSGTQLYSKATAFGRSSATGGLGAGHKCRSSSRHAVCAASSQEQLCPEPPQIAHYLPGAEISWLTRGPDCGGVATGGHCEAVAGFSMKLAVVSIDIFFQDEEGLQGSVVQLL
jgi:hypothetical protein